VWPHIIIRFEVGILLVKPMPLNKKRLIRRNFSILSFLSRIHFRAWQRNEFLNRLLRVIPFNNPAQNWNFVSQTDANEQGNAVSHRNFSILSSLSRDRFRVWQRKWNFSNRWLRVIPHINSVRNWNFISQTDANEQEKPVFTSEFLQLLTLALSCYRVRTL